MSQLAVPPAQDARLSQLLPTVKCTNCSAAVVFTELEDHVCPPPPPPPDPKLLAQRVKALENESRAASPAVAPQRRPSSKLSVRSRGPSPAPTVPLPATPAIPQQLPSRKTPSPGPARIVSPVHSLSSQRSLTPVSPDSISRLSRLPSPGPVNIPSTIPEVPTRVPNNSPPQVHHIFPPNRPILPNTSPSGHPHLQNTRPGGLPNRPPLQIQTNNVHPHNFGQPIPSTGVSPYPQYNETEPDLRAGGEAGMAGVGRRGFAAAARAAMFTASPLSPFPHAPLPPQGHPHYHPPPPAPLQPSIQVRRETPPQFLDVSPATLNRNSNVSDPDVNSPSPSPSPLPKSPSPQVPPGPVHTRSNSSNSIDSARIKAPTPPESETDVKPKRGPPPALNLANLPSFHSLDSPAVSSPAVSVARLPFFEKFKNKYGTPTTSRFPQLPDPAEDQTPKEDDKVADGIRPRSRQSSVSSSYSLKSNTIDQKPDSVTVERKFSTASSSSYASTSFAIGLGSKEPEHKPSETPLSPTMTESDCGGLAYADDTEEEEEAQTTSQPASNPNGVKFPSMASDASTMAGFGALMTRSRTPSQASEPESLRLRTTGQPDKVTSGVAPLRLRSNSASSSSSKTSMSSEYSRATGVGLGTSADSTRKEMQTLWEDQPLSQIREDAEESSSVHRSIAQRSNTVAHLSPSSDSTKAVKLPVRSKTERDSFRPRVASENTPERKPGKKRRAKICVRCEKRIEDGRWIDVDTEGKQRNGGVLCERCWKNMYLPKCRRCNLPIETQAVSSSDGLLKGKYHKDCFNCHQCHKPFPDKEFYVFDDKPLCAYHYHEANNSLCAAALCGQPIEGPCAVSHTGDRYHPEHLTCEWPEELGGCGERLVEYWEMDGRMLCEKHARGSPDLRADAEPRTRRSEKSQKRVTRFIDLAQGGLSGGKF